MNLKDHDIDWKKPHAKDSLWNVIYSKQVDKEHLHRKKNDGVLTIRG